MGKGVKVTMLYLFSLIFHGMLDLEKNKVIAYLECKLPVPVDDYLVAAIESSCPLPGGKACKQGGSCSSVMAAKRVGYSIGYLILTLLFFF